MEASRRERKAEANKALHVRGQLYVVSKAEMGPKMTPSYMGAAWLGRRDGRTE